MQRQFTPNDFRIDGNSAYIRLTNRSGSFIAEAIVDADQLQCVLAAGRWVANWNKNIRGYYVKTQGGKVMLHRFVMRAESGILIDHKNHDTLDCRRANLRRATNSQNMQNRAPHTSIAASGFRNVYRGRRPGTWQVALMVNKMIKSLGSFTDIEDAKRAAESGRRRYFSHATD